MRQVHARRGCDVAELRSVRDVDMHLPCESINLK